jgi:integrase
MGSNYLFTSRAGHPLGITSASNIVRRLRDAGFLPLECSWHSLRHTWAEEVAAHLFSQNSDQHLVMDKIRILGGWSETSSMPRYYAQLAIGAEARKDLSAVQRKYADQIARGGRGAPEPLPPDIESPSPSGPASDGSP